MTAKVRKVVANFRTLTMRCDHCGDTIPLPVGCAEWVGAIEKAFLQLHTGRHAGGRTGFARQAPTDLGASGVSQEEIDALLGTEPADGAQQ